MVLEKVEILYIILDVSKERGMIREKGVLQIHSTVNLARLQNLDHVSAVQLSPRGLEGGTHKVWIHVGASSKGF